jgi:pilus assembly protein Flp/PilA
MPPRTWGKYLPAAVAYGRLAGERAAVRGVGKMASTTKSVKTQSRERLDMKNFINRFVHEDEGQDLVEYALLIAFIALACIIGLQQLGTAINNTYNSISSSLSGAVS